MAACGQYVEHPGARVLLDLHAVPAVGKGSSKQEARSGERPFWAEPVVDDPRQQRCKRLRLAIRTLRSIKQMGLALLERDAWIEGVERPCARAQIIGRMRVVRKGRSAVLPEYSGVALDNAAAPVELDTLENTRRPPFRIDGCKEDRIPGLEHMRPCHRLTGIDLPGLAI